MIPNNRWFDNGRTGWTNTSGGATTASSTDSTNDVYGNGDGDLWYESSTCVYCEKEEEEEIIIEEEPYDVPNDEDLLVIRRYFEIQREPP